MDYKIKVVKTRQILNQAQLIRKFNKTIGNKSSSSVLTGNLLECVWSPCGLAGLEVAVGVSKPAAPGIFGSLYNGYGGIL